MIKSVFKQFLSRNTINYLHLVRAISAALFYRFPARGMTVIGVTGTNGKTTTCNLIAAIFEAAGEKVALATTIQFRINDQEWPNTSKMTTLSPWQLNSFLAKARKAKCTILVLETTSHALTQHRTWGIPYHTAAVTNLTHDHLDYHESFATYKTTKGRLFTLAKHGVINKDDPSVDYFKQLTHNRAISYGLANSADIMAKKIIFDVDKTSFAAVTPAGQITIDLALPGQFNIYNALAAIAVGVQHHLPLATIKKGLESIKLIRGRMEKIDCGQPFTVIIDYAHTPDAFSQIYATIKPIANGRICHVFGATGDRDKTKRPILGEIAAKNADFLFITDEDPYTEDPMKIIDTVASGVRKVREVKKVKESQKTETWWKILDRREAIRKALTLAKPKDIVLITGKGAEEAMVIGATHVPWSDRQAVEEELAKLGYSKSKLQ